MIERDNEEMQLRYRLYLETKEHCMDKLNVKMRNSFLLQEEELPFICLDWNLVIL